ncbi:SH3 domain-containing kinase-binding protein 1 [Hoplias malabaricus]|uniref:SH3 domain-containing kinase-binding protein 1 n=1 Tax=Hoplias malabaricus TaxID=27720 RepID=UPI00346181CE
MMGNYTSAFHADVEDFKAILSSLEHCSPDGHTMENSTLNNNNVSGAEATGDWGQNEPDISALKFLHSVPGPSRENTEPVAMATTGSPDPSGADLRRRQKALHPSSLEHLREEIQDMRGELEQLRSQHKREIKLMMNELDEEKKQRLSLQVEVERLKKHMSK